MTKNILLSICISFIGICLFFACTKEENDSAYPVIEFVSLDSLTPLKSGDVMYTDSPYVVRSTFRDADELSSYSIRIWSALLKNSSDTFTLKSSIEPLKDGEPDSAIFNRAFQDNNIWGIKDSSVTVLTSVKIDSAITAGGKRMSVSLGSYYLKVTVVGKTGNMTKDSFLIDVRTKPKEDNVVSSVQ